MIFFVDFHWQGLVIGGANCTAKHTLIAALQTIPPTDISSSEAPHSHPVLGRQILRFQRKDAGILDDDGYEM